MRNVLQVLGPACLAASLSLGCGSAQTTVASPGHGDEPSRVAAFQALEDEVLRDLATVDRRVASRGRIAPREEDLRRVSMGAVLAEDPSLAVVDGAIDPFSFEARARGLAGARKKLDAAPADLPRSANGMVPSPAFEKELLTRVVDEEIVRLDEERALPRSASSLLRAVIDTWTPPQNAAEAGERDRWLARRIREVASSVSAPMANGAAALDVVRARELDDALDALEHEMEASGLTLATAELVKLREALEAQGNRPWAKAASDWTAVSRRVRAHLGVEVASDALDAQLAGLQKELRAAAEAAIAKAPSPDAATEKASALVFASSPCVDAVPGSRVRSMAPPPERLAACHLRHAAAGANDAATRATILVAMHDHVVVSRWALDVARGASTIAQATGKYRPLSRPGPDVAARWERIALARPTVAIGGGLAAGVLFAGPDVVARGKRWSELGEVPLDVAARELKEADAPAAPAR